LFISRIPHSNRKQYKHLQLTFGSIRQAVLQGFLSLGDEETGKIIFESELGNRSWKTAAKEKCIDLTKMLFTPRKKETVFPWSFVNHDIDREVLWQRYQTYRKRFPH